MKDNAVTLSQKSEYILVGGLFLAITLIVGIVACFSRKYLDFAIAVITLIIAVCFFLNAGNRQTLNENGIHIKNCFGEKQFSWDRVEKVKISQTSHKYLPEIYFYIKGRKLPVYTPYTQRTLKCLLCYYGEPDEDRVKKPPTTF